MKKIAVFASGSGTNAENIIRHFSTGNVAEVVVLLTNNPYAPVIERAKKLGVETIIFDRVNLWDEKGVASVLRERGVDLIVLAGFLWLIPPAIIGIWEKRILNIHPAILPAFGGKGMYGNHVHKAVLEAKVKKSGITIHIVNEVYDTGDILFQAEVVVDKGESVSSLAAKIHALEKLHFPLIIESFIKDSDR